ncbi:hypothetical protein [Aliamphritea spongicola]|nr:hypothetical protein [Aliamphritea spongicola]
MEANKLMLLLRTKARERKTVQENLKLLSKQINLLSRELRMSKVEGDIVNVRKRHDRLVLRFNTAKDRLVEQDESLAPLVIQWYQRWQDFTNSQALALEVNDQQLATPMVLIGDSEQIDYSPEVISNNDFGLARTVLEQALCYVRTGQEVPEDCRRLVKNFLNSIFSAEAEELLLSYNEPRSAEVESWLTATLASLVADVFGDEKAQDAAEGKVKLGFNTNLKQGITTLCKQPSLTTPDSEGLFSNLQQIRINVVPGKDRKHSKEDP